MLGALSACINIGKKDLWVAGGGQTPTLFLWYLGWIMFTTMSHIWVGQVLMDWREDLEPTIVILHRAIILSRPGVDIMH